MPKIARVVVFIALAGILAAAVWGQPADPVVFGRRAVDEALAARGLKAAIAIDVAGPGEPESYTITFAGGGGADPGGRHERRHVRRPRAGGEDRAPWGRGPARRRRHRAALPARPRLEHVPDPALGLRQERYRLRSAGARRPGPLVVRQRRLLAHALRPDGPGPDELARHPWDMGHQRHRRAQPLRLLHPERALPEGRRLARDQGGQPAPAQQGHRHGPRPRHPGEPDGVRGAIPHAPCARPLPGERKRPLRLHPGDGREDDPPGARARRHRLPDRGERSRRGVLQRATSRPSRPRVATSRSSPGAGSPGNPWSSPWPRRPEISRSRSSTTASNGARPTCHGRPDGRLVQLFVRGLLERFADARTRPGSGPATGRRAARRGRPSPTSSSGRSGPTAPTGSSRSTIPPPSARPSSPCPSARPAASSSRASRPIIRSRRATTWPIRRTPIATGPTSATGCILTLWGRLGYDPGDARRRRSTPWSPTSSVRPRRARRRPGSGQPDHPRPSRAFSLGPDHRNHAIELEWGGDTAGYMAGGPFDSHVFKSVQEHAGRRRDGRARRPHRAAATAARLLARSRRRGQSAAQIPLASPPASASRSGSRSSRPSAARSRISAVITPSGSCRPQRSAEADAGNAAAAGLATAHMQEAAKEWAALAACSFYKPFTERLRMRTNTFHWSQELPKVQAEAERLAKRSRRPCPIPSRCLHRLPACPGSGSISSPDTVTIHLPAAGVSRAWALVKPLPSSAFFHKVPMTLAGDRFEYAFARELWGHAVAAEIERDGHVFRVPGWDADAPYLVVPSRSGPTPLIYSSEEALTYLDPAILTPAEHGLLLVSSRASNFHRIFNIPDPAQGPRPGPARPDARRPGPGLHGRPLFRRLAARSAERRHPNSPRRLRPERAPQDEPHRGPGHPPAGLSAEPRMGRHRRRRHGRPHVGEGADRHDQRPARRAPTRAGRRGFAHGRPRLGPEGQAGRRHRRRDRGRRLHDLGHHRSHERPWHPVRDAGRGDGQRPGDERDQADHRRRGRRRHSLVARISGARRWSTLTSTRRSKRRPPCPSRRRARSSSAGARSSVTRSCDRSGSTRCRRARLSTSGSRESSSARATGSRSSFSTAGRISR